jgi:hypothetical protein
MFNEPAHNEQSNSEHDGYNREPVLSSPPECEQKADAQDYAGNLARNNVEPTEYKQSTNEGGPKIASWERDGADSSLHVRYSALPWIKRDGFDTSSCAARRYGVSKFVKSNDKHLSATIQ